MQILCRPYYLLAQQPPRSFTRQLFLTSGSHGRFCQMVKRIGAALLWPLALAFLFVGFNKNDPYLILLRGSGNVAVAALGVLVAVMLIRRGYWRGAAQESSGPAGAWCRCRCSPRICVSNSASRTSCARKLPRPTGLVGTLSSATRRSMRWRRLAEKGLIAGVYVTRHNLNGRSAEALKAEISRASGTAARRAPTFRRLIVAADQEGGIVPHFAPVLTELPALATLADLPADLRDRMAEEYGRIHGRELATLGVNHQSCAGARSAAGDQAHTISISHTLIGCRAISERSRRSGRTSRCPISVASKHPASARR